MRHLRILKGPVWVPATSACIAVSEWQAAVYRRSRWQSLQAFALEILPHFFVSSYVDMAIIGLLLSTWNDRIMDLTKPRHQNKIITIACGILFIILFIIAGHSTNLGSGSTASMFLSHENGFLNTTSGQNHTRNRKNRGNITMDHNPVTVVTAYYTIPSKFSNAQYLQWIKNFLGTIPCYLYIFTDENTYGILQKLREPFLDRTKFIIRPFEELKMARL